MQSLSRLLEYSFYHLDGFNAVVHLPRMLEIPELTGIQFSHGAGRTLTEALPVYKQIQQSGKVQWIECAPDEVELVLRELDPRGLLIFTSTPDIESGKALLKKAETWSCRVSPGVERKGAQEPNKGKEPKHEKNSYLPREARRTAR